MSLFGDFGKNLTKRLVAPFETGAREDALPDRDEIQKILQENEALKARVEEQEKHIRDLKLDPTTGLPRFEVFRNEIEARSEPYTVVKIDVDRFKDINEDYLQEGGNKVLAGVARMIGKAFPGQAYRWGGDEFLVVIPNCRNVKKTADAVNVLRQKIEDERFMMRRVVGGRPCDEELKVTISSGVAMGLSGAALPDVLESADTALHKAKGGGSRLTTLLHGNTVFYIGILGKLKEYGVEKGPEVQPREEEAKETTFDPQFISTKNINQLVKKFGGEERASSADGISERMINDNIRYAAILIQAGARGLLEPEERGGVYLPIQTHTQKTGQEVVSVQKHNGEPETILQAQSMYFDIYRGARQATTEEKKFFLNVISEGADLLEKCGYLNNAEDVHAYVAQSMREANDFKPLPCGQNLAFLKYGAQASVSINP